MINKFEYLNDGIAAFEAKHFTIAIQILEPLAELGNAEAQFRMAIMQQNGLGMAVNPQKAFENMKKSAEQDHSLALHGLGFMYFEGECITQDYMAAIKWFKKAANNGMTGSMMTISTMYADGLGVKQDTHKAKEWMDKATKT